MMIRLVVVDDHEVIRRGLASLLAGTDIEIVGDAADGRQAVERVRDLQPNVVLLDVRLPGEDGFWTLERINRESPDTKVIMLSTYDNPTYIARAVVLGASAYVLKGASRDELMSTIHAVVRGDTDNPDLFPRGIGSKMSSLRSSPLAGNGSESLSERQTQVLRHVALGLSNREIAKSLEIDVQAVKQHVQDILRTLDVTDRTQAAVWAVRNGLV